MKRVFIVGCPRSGTTWFQLLLAQHENVVTTQETHLFNGYLSGLEATWNHWRSFPDGLGMGSILTDEEFNDLCAEFACKVLGKIAATNPSATVVAEKTPQHVRYAGLIAKLLPDSYFIHLVRDPRSVVSSLCAAGASWGSNWASRRPITNARMWRSDVATGREIGEMTDRFTEVRYEDLRGQDGPRALDRVFASMGLAAGEEFCEQALETCSFNRLKNRKKTGDDLRGFGSVKRSAQGFYRKGRTDSWKEDMAPHDIKLIEYITRDLMATYGYRPVATNPEKTRSKPPRLLANEILEGLEWRAIRSVHSVFQKALSAL